MKKVCAGTLVLLLCMAILCLLTSALAGEPATLEVRVFHDRNSNGVRDLYDPGVAGAVVELIPEGSDTPIASVTTDKDAEPVFSGIPGGRYFLRITAPTDMGFSKTGTDAKAAALNIMSYSLERVQSSPVLELAEGGNTAVAVGLTKLAGISGIAWNDLNGDGIMQADEPGQAGVTISLTGVNNGLVYELVTDDTGVYYIGQVKPGNYKMTITTPDGTMFTKYSKTGGANRSFITTEGKNTDSRSFKLEAGDLLSERHIGVVGDGAICVQCFLDANYNGLMDEGEEPLAGVKVEVVKSNGKTVANVVSDQDGKARASSLRNGEFSLTAIIPEGDAFTCEAEDGNLFYSANGRRKDTVKNISVATGSDTVIYLGAVKPASISGTAYLDDNFSGAMESNEKTVSGLIVTLLNASGQTVATARTNAKGVYTFDDLNPGIYAMRLTAKAGYAFTKTDEGSRFINLGDGQGETEAFNVPMGAQLTGMDIGQILPGTVQGSVFADANDNGLWDEGETGLAGTVVRLMAEDGVQFSASIGADGAFCFDAVMPGRYYLQYELPGESVLAKVVQGGNTVEGEGTTVRGEWFDFAVGDTVEAPLCGGLRLVSITGIAFADHNANGVQDETESPLAGVTLTLQPSRGDLSAASVTTQADGVFAIAGLHPDAYTLTVEQPEGYVTSRAEKLALTAGLNVQTIALNIGMGDVRNDLSLGGVRPASIRGKAWLDENFDGLYTEGETAPADATVEIIDQLDGTTAAVATIQADGSFAAENLLPGSYTLHHGPAIEGKTGDSTFIYENGMMVMQDVTLAEGTERNDLLLGVVCHTSIGGKAWADMGETVAPVPGAEVFLRDGEGTVLAKTVTDESGAYIFDGLMPGQFSLQVFLPEGRVAVEPEDDCLAKNGCISVMTQCSGRQAESDVFDLQMSRDLLSMDIGAVLPGSIGDLCWLDENANGLQDSGENGIPHVTIQLVRGDTVVAETTSDQYGFYRFTDVYPATYTLRVTAPAEVTPTVQRTDIPLLASVLGDDYISAPVQVVSGQANRNADLGFVLIEPDHYPADYGQGETQKWTVSEE